MSSRPPKMMDRKPSPFRRGPLQPLGNDKSNRKNAPIDSTDKARVTKPGVVALTASASASAAAAAKLVPPTASASAAKLVPPTATAVAVVASTDIDPEAKVGEGEDYSELVPVSSKTQVKTIDFKAESAAMDRIFEEQAANQLKDLPAFKRPKRFKKSIKFYDHQQDGIRWLIQQERNPRPNPFCYTRQLKDGTVAAYDQFTKRRLTAGPHSPVRGSILADEMGLGKTVQTLALIMSNPPEGTSYGTTSNAYSANGPKCTLIISPKSVMSNWQTQISDFVRSNTFQVAKYVGNRQRRAKIIDQVQEGEIDILLSSYETIAAEFSNKARDKKGNVLAGIHDISFHRVCLDEAQQIRNPKSNGFKAVMALEGTHKLALTGTPFVNNPEDIYSLFCFIGLDPLSDKDCYKYQVTNPIKERRRYGLFRLRAALAYSALRRTKNVVDLEMVEKTVHISTIDFPEGGHKEIHDCLYFAARVAFDASINGVGKDYTESEHGISALVAQSSFEMLLRVRQSCGSGMLVPYARYHRARTAMEDLRDENGDIKKLTAKEGNKMIDFLLQAKSEGGETASEEDYPDDLGVSPKVQALLDEIENMKSDEKGVIFSQWTKMLDLIQKPLQSAGYSFVRIDGTMSSDQRTESLQKLAQDDNVRFMLCSLRTAGVGLNLTRANVVFMMDPWWNDAVESQAIDRVHRMFQTRPCRIYRFVMKDTLEERMISIVQKGKQMMGKGTMVKLTKQEEKSAKITALKDLFQIKEGELNDFIDDSEDWS